MSNSTPFQFESRDFQDNLGTLNTGRLSKEGHYGGGYCQEAACSDQHENHAFQRCSSHQFDEPQYALNVYTGFGATLPHNSHISADTQVPNEAGLTIVGFPTANSTDYERFMDLISDPHDGNLSYQDFWGDLDLFYDSALGPGGFVSSGYGLASLADSFAPGNPAIATTIVERNGCLPINNLFPPSSVSLGGFLDTIVAPLAPTTYQQPLNALSHNTRPIATTLMSWKLQSSSNLTPSSNMSFPVHKGQSKQRSSRALSITAMQNSPLPQQIKPQQYELKVVNQNHGFSTFRLQTSSAIGLPSSACKQRTRDQFQRSENVCLQCKTRKKTCVYVDKAATLACNRCINIAKGDLITAQKFCVKQEQILLPTVQPGVYLDFYLAISKKILPSLSSQVQQVVIEIVAACVAHEFPHYQLSNQEVVFSCTVEEIRIARGHDAFVDMIHYQLFDRLCHGLINPPYRRKLQSFAVPEGYQLDKSRLREWAKATLSLVPGGSVGGLQGPLCRFAACYVEQAGASLKNLVTLAWEYTAIYNICVGQIWVRSSVTEHLYNCPPKFRAQICSPLRDIFQETGRQLQQLLVQKLYSHHGPSPSEQVPLCLTLWLLVTLYGHISSETASVEILWLLGLDEADKKRLNTRQRAISEAFDTHVSVYQAIFKRHRNSFCPIFNNALISMAGIDRSSAEFLLALDKLRISMRQFEKNSAVLPDYGRQDEFGDLANLLGTINIDVCRNEPPLQKHFNKAAAPENQACSMSDDNLGSPVSETSRRKRKSVNGCMAKWIQEYDSQEWLFE